MLLPSNDTVAVVVASRLGLETGEKKRKQVYRGGRSAEGMHARHGTPPFFLFLVFKLNAALHRLTLAAASDMVSVLGISGLDRVGDLRHSR